MTSSLKGRVRFSKAAWFDHVVDAPVTVIGAGGIGSWLTHFLCRAGANVKLYDADVYNMNNMGGQLTRPAAMAKNKADSCAQLMYELLGEQRVTSVNEFFTDQSRLDTAPVFIAVDDMNARKIVYDAWKQMDINPKILIDGRMGAEQFELVTATPEADNYMSHWFPPDEAAALPCAYRATSHVGSMLASVMMGIYTNWAGGDYVPETASFIMQTMELES